MTTAGFRVCGFLFGNSKKKEPRNCEAPWYAYPAEYYSS